METGKDCCELYVSLDGNDAWSGLLQDPNAAGTDGPLATLDGARRAVRRLRERALTDAPVTVWLRGGRYRLDRPVRFGPRDSGVTYCGYPGEKPVFDGGVEIGNFEAGSVHGRPAWIADVAGHLLRYGAFRSLFVDGSRRPRPRLPRQGTHRLAEVPKPPRNDLCAGSDRFRLRAGDARAWRNFADVEIVLLHFWIEERMPVESVDSESGWVISSRRSVYMLHGDADGEGDRYYIENVFEALTEPGEWYLDRAEAKLYYLPRPGEQIGTTRVVVPVIQQMVRIEGDPDAGRPVAGLRLRGLQFEHTDWAPLPGGRERYDPLRPDEQVPTVSAGREKALASSVQGACCVPGVIAFEGAEHCAVEDCRILRVGYYGIDFGDGCFGNRAIGNVITDAGAGGIRLGGADHAAAHHRQNGRHRLTDNHLFELGRVFHSACGVLLMHSFGNEVSHNHIHDLYYTGVSCGWVWGYTESVCRENRIEKNHIHHLGCGLLSDMGGVYTLGVQPGTSIRGNLIHDIEKATYGGWAIYPDEGSSHIVIENNICYNTSSQLFHMHFGRELIVRNNIFAFGREGQVSLTHGPAHEYNYPWCGRNQTCSVTFLHNIVLTEGEPVFVTYCADVSDSARPIASDLNCFWNVTGGPIVSGKLAHNQHGLDNLQIAFDWQMWQELGYDTHSVIADPGFADPAEGNFALPEDSPVFALGFRRIDLSDVGIRPKDRRRWR